MWIWRVLPACLADFSYEPRKTSLTVCVAFFISCRRATPSGAKENHLFYPNFNLITSPHKMRHYKKCQLSRNLLGGFNNWPLHRLALFWFLNRAWLLSLADKPCLRHLLVVSCFALLSLQNTPPPHWPTITFYPESCYRPPLSGAAWFVQDRGCVGAPAGTQTVLALTRGSGWTLWQWMCRELMFTMMGERGSGSSSQWVCEWRK